MKKIILLALAMTATLAANAQLKVDNNGIVQIGASSFGDADLRIKGTHDKGLLVIDGCTLYNADIRLEQGASLKIINGGVIQCRNGFYAPLGVNIEIDEGKIS